MLRYLPRTDHSTQTRSLRSRVDWAVEAARRVRGGLVVAALKVDGLRGGAGAPTDAGSERPTCREGDRRAEQGGTPLRGPARLVQQPVGHFQLFDTCCPLGSAPPLQLADEDGNNPSDSYQGNMSGNGGSWRVSATNMTDDKPAQIAMIGAAW